MRPNTAPMPIPAQGAPSCDGVAGIAVRAIICGRAMRDQLRRCLAPRQVGEQEFMVLWVCRAAPGLVQKALARQLGVSPAQVSSLVEGLRRQGLLDGRRPAGDRRRQEWHLTQAGHTLLDAVDRDLATDDGLLETALAPYQPADFLSALERFVGCFEDSSSTLRVGHPEECTRPTLQSQATAGPRRAAS
jgi:DNA-binding MarR family transcriptional regulator